jgi:DNA-binding NarL/FixJ family response regulator
LDVSVPITMWMPSEQVLVCAEPSTAERVADFLRSRGYVAETANDGGRAVELAEQSHPDLVLAWSDLSGPPAPELIRRLRGGSSRIRVAAVLRRADVDQASTLRRAGANALLLEAEDLEFLAWALDRVVEGRFVVDPALAQRLAAPPSGDEAGGDDFADNGSPVEPALARPEFTRYEPGVDFSECDVAEIVDQGAAQAARAYPSVLVQVSAPPRLTALAEPAALLGVVRILVDNACRDSEAGSDVTVKAQRGDAGITVLVTDRGQGLDRRRGATASAAPADEGSALGLNLARSLVALHGGILWAEPLPSGGSRVSFTIPEEPPLLAGVELQEAIHALDLLERIEASPEPEPPSAEEPDEEGLDGDGQLLEDALDLAAAAADAAALAHPPSLELEDRAGLLEDPVASLADLFDLGPDAAEPADIPAADTAEPADLPAADTTEPADLPAADAAEPVADDEVVTAVEPDLPIEAEVLPPAEPMSLPDPMPPEDEPLSVPDVEPVDEPPSEPDPADEPLSLPVPEPTEEPSAPDEVPEGEAPKSDPVEVPEPVPAAHAAAEAPKRREPVGVVPSKTFIPDPLHPATAILRDLAEDFDRHRDGRPGF